MNLPFDKTDSRQRTVYLAVQRLSLHHNVRAEPDGSMSLNLLRIYIESEGIRVLSGAIAFSTLESYLSALSAIHLDSFINWLHIRKNPCIRRILSRLEANAPQRMTKQDYAVSHRELLSFCCSLDHKNYEHVLAAAISTTLFWGIGRVPEILHAKAHSRMKMSSIIPYTLDKGGRAFKIFLERPKIKRSSTQYITPVQSYDKTNPSYWMTMLQIMRPKTFTSPWQLSSTSHADHTWLFGIFSTFVSASKGLLGPCSFRAGGFSHMLSTGYDFRLLAALGRWASDAVDRYIRDHPQIIVQAFASRNSSMRMDVISSCLEFFSDS
jgi:hypothetical protein